MHGRFPFALQGAMDFAVKVDCSDLGAPPRVAALPLSRSAVVRPDGTGAWQPRPACSWLAARLCT